jgi:dimethylargininase
MKTILEPRSYQVRGVRVTGCLHLKSAITQVSLDTLLINPEWVSKDDFPGMNFIEVDPSEPYAANAVLVDGTIVYASSYPKTQAKLQANGIRMIIVDADELAKAEGAVTCCSLIFNA